MRGLNFQAPKSSTIVPTSAWVPKPPCCNRVYLLAERNEHMTKSAWEGRWWSGPRKMQKKSGAKRQKVWVLNKDQKSCFCTLFFLNNRPKCTPKIFIFPNAKRQKKKIDSSRSSQTPRSEGEGSLELPARGEGSDPPPPLQNQHSLNTVSLGSPSGLKCPAQVPGAGTALLGGGGRIGPKAFLASAECPPAGFPGFLDCFK